MDTQNSVLASGYLELVLAARLLHYIIALVQPITVDFTPTFFEKDQPSSCLLAIAMARNIPSRGRAQPVRGTSPFSSVRRMPARAAKFRTGMANPAPTSTRNPTRSPTRNEAGVNPEQPTRNDSTENNHSVEAGSNSSFIRSRAPSPSPRTALFHNAAPTGSQAVLSEEERVNSWIEAVEHADGRKGVIMSTDSPLYIKTIRIPQTDDGLSYSGTTTITDSVVRRGQILQKDTAEEEIAKMRAGDLSNAADIEEPEKRVKKAQGGGVIKERKKFNTRALRAKARNAARKAATKEQCTIGGTVGNIANNVAPVNEHLGGGEHNVNQGSAPVDTSAYSAEDIEAACILMQMSGADAELVSPNPTFPYLTSITS